MAFLKAQNDNKLSLRQTAMAGNPRSLVSGSRGTKSPWIRAEDIFPR